MEIETEEFTDLETGDEKMSSINHAGLQSYLAFLLNLSYRNQYSIYTELDLEFASGKTRPDLCIFPKRPRNWMEDEIVVQDVPLTTIEILAPEQSMTSLIDRVYKKHFPAGVKTVWMVFPAIQIISIFFPDRQRINFTDGMVIDPTTGIQLALAEVFEG